VAYFIIQNDSILKYPVQSANPADDFISEVNTPTQKLDLSPYSIHLWYCFCDEIDDNELLLRYYALLSAPEKQRQRRFYFPRHRHQYLVTRALIRTLLSLYDDVPPTRWEFSKNQYGRPEIAEGIGSLPIRFNLSHTDGLIVCGIMLDHHIGVDTENLKRNNRALSIADRYFSRSEVQALRQQPKAFQKQRFFDYWTLKEAYIKARGRGLSLPLRHFSFHIPRNAPITISFDCQIADDPSQWQFWRFKASPQHQVAVGVKLSQSVNISSRQIVPLSHWSELQGRLKIPAS